MSIAVKAWNMMGGIDWTAMPVVAEYYGVQDVELLIDELIAIRDHIARQASV